MFLTIFSSIGFLIVCVAAVVLTLVCIASLFSMDGSKCNFIVIFVLVTFGLVILHHIGAFAYPLA